MSRPQEQRSQHYEPRVEQAVEAMVHGLRTVELLARFLSLQQSPGWRELGGLFDDAIRDFGKAVASLEKPDRLPTKPKPATGRPERSGRPFQEVTTWRKRPLTASGRHSASWPQITTLGY